MSMDDGRENLEAQADPVVVRPGPGRRFIGAVSVAVIAAFVLALWYAYDQGVNKGVSLAPPVIKAPEGPVKIKPEEPGGMEIPNQDKQVYQAMEATKPEPKVEQLLPPPEEPEPEVEPAQPQPSVELETAAKPEVEVKPVEPPTAPATATETAKVETEPKPAPQPASKPAPPPAKKKAAAPKPQQQVAAAAQGSFMIQLASFRNEQAANNAWKTIGGKHAPVLKSLKQRVLRIDLGSGKGVFYRLQAGGFPTRAAAESACAKLKAQKQGCLVVAR